MLLCRAGRQPTNRPTATSGPSACSASRPSLTAKWGRLASRQRHRRHPSSLPLWLTLAPKRGRAGHGRLRDTPRGHPAHPCRPRTPRATAAIRCRRRDPHGSPNPSRLGGIHPLPTYPQEGEEEEDGGARSSTTRREVGAAREEEPDPREPSTPATPCFLGFLFTAPSTCFPYQCRLLPRHRAAHPFTDACASASGHPGEDAVSSPLWTPRPSSRGGTFRATAPLHRCW
jgi:hypothetical protein